jgi:hypothetical protein
VDTEWQRSISGVSGVHSIIMAQACKVGGARQSPFTLFTIAVKVMVYAPVERADTLPLFLLYHYMYSVAEMLNSAFIILRIRSHSFLIIAHILYSIVYV